MPPKKAAAKKAAAKKPTSALQRAEEAFRDSWGQDSLDNSGIVEPYEVISTGCLSVDYSMGVGGYVLGRLYEVWGVDAIGKTTFVMQGAREAQRQYPDRIVAWIDVEHTFDKAWALVHGIDLERLWIIRPESAEHVADQVKDLIRTGIVSMVVLDSIGAMIPEAEKEKDADKAVMAQQAKIVTRMVKIAAVEADANRVVVIMLNQVRANLSYGADTTTGGGFALKHVTTGKLKLSRSGTEPFKAPLPGESGPVRVGHEVVVMNERNKVAPPFKRAQFVLFTTASEKYGPPGIDRVDDAVTMGIKTGVIAQSGAWYTLPGADAALQGREAVVGAVREDPELLEVIRTRTLATLSGEIIVGDEADPLADPETGEILSEGSE